MKPREVTAVVLAGGASRRMGGAKLLLDHRGQSLLARAVKTAQRVCERVVVVVGAYAEAYRPEAEAAGAEVIENPAWSEGLASSLRAGVAAAAPGSRQLLVLLADQPFVTADHLRELLAEADRSGADLVLSRYPQGVLGVPAVIRSRLFGRVATLRGERGARALLPFAHGVGEVPLTTPEDIDTPEEAERWLEDPQG